MKTTVTIIILLMVIPIFGLQAQKSEIYFRYGGSFIGAGDYQGRNIGIGYQHDISRRISIFVQLDQASMSGQDIGPFFRNDLEMLGSDAIHNGIFDLYDIDRQNYLSDKYSPGSKRNLPSYAMTNAKTILTGIRIYPYKGKKVKLFVEGNMGLSKLENTNFVRQQVVILEEDTYFNFGNYQYVILNTPTQDNFLDFGYGYGVGAQFSLSDRITMGGHGAYTEYLRDAQNIVTWSATLGFRL